MDRNELRFHLKRMIEDEPRLKGVEITSPAGWNYILCQAVRHINSVQIEWDLSICIIGACKHRGRLTIMLESLDPKQTQVPWVAINRIRDNAERLSAVTCQTCGMECATGRGRCGACREEKK